MTHMQRLRAERPRPGAPDRTEAARLVAAFAGQALLTEVMLTPKPGLVDQRNSGAHRDMDLQTFLDSARAITGWFPRFVRIGMSQGRTTPPHGLLPQLRSMGLLCERAMFQATHGVNTHKGAIFSLGLLCAAAGCLLANGHDLEREEICAKVAAICIGLVNRELSSRNPANTAGERMFLQHGLAGARGEAASGYATVRSAALPVYDGLRLDGIGEELALSQALLHLLAVNGDTNLVSRGGIEGLHHVRRHAKDMLLAGGALAPGGLDGMAAFDDDLIARNLSPSGSADLLAVTWFLAQFPGTVEASYRPSCKVP